MIALTNFAGVAAVIGELCSDRPARRRRLHQENRCSFDRIVFQIEQRLICFA